ncbi:F protein [Cereibacter sphaeroides WS8N]|uniref:phage head morphogenesis protein n=1 Tax=Cereibacter sphaeroides TaxID=1063 RepID=UPI00020B032D|nr:phage minor head protein [Cereibacter sphaeroides]EGJ20108.1 F protein [Cereibacter sphaeroides WS8N]
MAEGFPDRPGYSFDPGPPPEASRYLRNKGLRPAFSFMDVEPEEHAVAFCVAKVMELDLAEAMRGEVQKALDQGLPFEAFMKSWRSNPKLADWWGRREMVDPVTGERVEAQLGSPRRLRTIYNANLRTARAAGQWERIERTKAAFPFLEYRTGPSETHRKHHLAKAGLILPVDAAFWDEWMPPNGWGCKCWVRQVTAAEAKRRGISAEPEVPDAVWENERTGERRIVPQGIDPGWQRNPGKLRLQNMEAVLVDKLEALPEAARAAAIRDIATSWRAERVLKGQAPGAVPVAVLPADVAAAVGMSRRVIRTTSDYGRKFLDKEREVTTATLLALTEALESGTLLIERGKDSDSLLVISRGEAPWLFALKLLPGSGEIWVRTMHRLKAAKLRRLMSDDAVTVLRE